MSPFDGQQPVMYQPNKIMNSGTSADPDFKGGLAFDADGRTAVLDMSAPTPAWRETSPMAFGRAYHNLTLLPDGSVLASGGSSRSDGIDLSKSALPAEIWNPDTETWTTVDSLQNGRQYHSTALLLPDGRVLMAGGGAFGRGDRREERRDLLAAVPLQGLASADREPDDDDSYGTTFDVNTRRSADRESLPDPHPVRDTWVRHEPAVQDPQLHGQRRHAHRDGAAQRERRAAGRLPPLPGEHERCALGRLIPPPVPGPTLGDTTPPTVSVTAAGEWFLGERNDPLDRDDTDNDPVVGVTFLLDGANLDLEDPCAPYSLLGHDHDDERRAHDHGRQRATPPGTRRPPRL